ncbi:hypothetical protein CLAFUW4_13623 [Fulvia fulva]|uniref:Uncharacterized protein n=1 Tax=Passalora fulva TaxID=5499 RepID=A0A9Q8PLB8_PASFU|nr:uncharacterized protein CLAFUR5_13475 [Fulvia fulva]KAK4610642.1 hypothetical protein CLAFUR4_13626 [Fulvia fulva]KAK4610934.1 hypothetical protein CLAFUR0_13630 [Fulvia fulva]UJO24556.1 hypothetical protein CLAFUR5_13475 [Fulvia fulva]WPV22306.1 hypothetical protein CLAFUW4_13623 [Fulvia fulva]WPV36734.1 hypothetical protein CLAFUW7_13631 [Fulvia fulva]
MILHNNILNVNNGSPRIVDYPPTWPVPGVTSSRPASQGTKPPAGPSGRASDATTKRKPSDNTQASTGQTGVPPAAKRQRKSKAIEHPKTDDLNGSTVLTVSADKPALDTTDPYLAEFISALTHDFKQSQDYLHIPAEDCKKRLQNERDYNLRALNMLGQTQP